MVCVKQNEVGGGDGLAWPCHILELRSVWRMNQELTQSAREPLESPESTVT